MLVWVGNPELVGMLHIVLLHADKERRGRAHDKKRPGQVTNYQKNKRPSFYTKVKCCRMIDQRIREVQLCKGYRDSLTGDKNRNENRNERQTNTQNELTSMVCRTFTGFTREGFRLIIGFGGVSGVCARNVSVSMLSSDTSASLFWSTRRKSYITINH